jgi:predicted enzyme related to lactoylglutathione lyase
MPLVSAYPAGAPCWIDLVATDREVARTFYAAVFGWQISEGHATDAPYLIARQDGHTVAGISTATPEGPPPGWTTYFSCQDAAALAERVRASGGTTILPPAAEEDNGAVTTFRDPSGTTAGGWRAGRVAGAQLTREPNSLARVELHSADPSAAVTFYTSVLGVAAQSDGPGRVALQVDGQTIGGIVAETGNPGWLPYFAVQDAIAVARSARTAGGMINISPIASPFGRWAHLQDPQGGCFGVIELPAKSR